MTEPATRTVVDPLIVETIAETWELKGERWPIVRTGEREPIPGIVRHLIGRRDNELCTVCSGSMGGLHLDHIVPWSAGGADTSDNLRLLCEGHNMDRSNFREAYLPRVLPVTIACDFCLMNHDGHVNRHMQTTYWQYCVACRGYDFDLLDGRIAAFCGTCTATSWVSDPRRLL